MINRDYEERVDEDDQTITYATLHSDNLYIEVPKGSLSETEVQLSLDDTLLQSALLNANNSQCRDDVYCDKKLVRQDYTEDLTEAKVLIEELQAAFPNYDILNVQGSAYVGRYTAYREPYDSTGISFYSFGEKPSEALLLNFGTSHLNSNLQSWYGLKFDLDTKKVLLKVVFRKYDGEVPALPQNQANFYATTHDEDGTVNDWVDYYAYATPKFIREFCAEKGLSYPLPPALHTECDVVWCWGFVFNRTTLEYGPVKAYARYNM